MIDDETRAAYREAWEAWQFQIEKLHAFLLGGEALTPPAIKGLLNREARAKQRYEKARRRLLGIAE